MILVPRLPLRLPLRVSQDGAGTAQGTRALRTGCDVRAGKRHSE